MMWGLSSWRVVGKLDWEALIKRMEDFALGEKMELTMKKLLQVAFYFKKAMLGKFGLVPTRSPSGSANAQKISGHLAR